MNPARLIIVALVVWLGYLLIRRVIRSSQGNAGPANGGTGRDTRKGYAPMVRCDYCQLHIPQATALTRNDHFYCSEEHFQLKQRGA